MKLEEFEARYREIIEQNLDQLQTSVLLLSQISQIEANLLRAGQNLQTLSSTVEEFINQQRTN